MRLLALSPIAWVVRLVSSIALDKSEVLKKSLASAARLVSAWESIMLDKPAMPIRLLIFEVVPVESMLSSHFSNLIQSFAAVLLAWAMEWSKVVGHTKIMQHKKIYEID